MRKPYSLIGLFMVFSVGMVLAQGTGQAPASAGSAQHPQTSAQPAATADKPAATTQQSPSSSSSSVSTSGGLAGTAGSSAVAQPETPDSLGTVGAPADSDLQAQLRNALSREPTLSHDSVNATVSADAIELSGSVATGREKQTATRIAQSFAINKKVVSHITISGNAAPVAPNAAVSGETHGESHSGKAEVPSSKSKPSTPNPPL